MRFVSGLSPEKEIFLSLEVNGRVILNLDYRHKHTKVTIFFGSSSWSTYIISGFWRPVFQFPKDLSNSQPYIWSTL